MIDGGSGKKSEFDQNNTGRIRAADYLFHHDIKELDLLVITHIHLDHVGGLEKFIVQGGIVRECWIPCPLPSLYPDRVLENEGVISADIIKFTETLNIYNRIMRTLVRQDCLIKQVKGIQENISLTDSLMVDILSPLADREKTLAASFMNIYQQNKVEDAIKTLDELDRTMNLYSLVLRFHYQGVKILLPGDALPDIHALQEWIGMTEADILKLAHHGHRDNTSHDFIAAVSPRLVVTCTSSDKLYNSGNEDVCCDIGRIMAGKGIEPVFLFTDRINGNIYDESDKPREAIAVTIDKGISYEILLPEKM